MRCSTLSRSRLLTLLQKYKHKASEHIQLLCVFSMLTMRLHKSLYLLEAAMLILLAGYYQHILADSGMFAPLEVSLHNGTLYGACKMRPNSLLAEGLPSVYGHVLFKQEYPQGKLNILLWLKGFPTEGDPQSRAVHIHQYGDLSQGCDSTGGHYNPHAVHHPNHPGDFGNFLPQQGKIRALIESEAILFERVSGRAVVIHEKMDDLGLGGDAGSLLHGNAGRRLGCCVIGISSPNLWDMYYKQYRG